MKTVEERFMELTDEELAIAFCEYEEWRKTSVLFEGVLRSVYDQLCADTGRTAVLSLISEPFLYVIITRFKYKPHLLFES